MSPMNNRLLRPTNNYDADALRYINAVQVADGQALEPEVRTAIDAFVRGCKSDSAGYAGDPTRTVWDALQACCIMCGARTISGALVPLKTPYGSELVDIDALPTPTIEDGFGSAGAWDASTRTFSNTATSTSSTYPRMRLGVGMTSGKQYRISGRLSGDFAKLHGVRVADFTYLSIDAATGSFDSVVSAGYAYVEFLLNGTFGASSVTIESLSIREDSFTPTPYNFASGDYSRTTGLKGDGSTKYLDSNRADDDDPQDSHHLCVYATTHHTRTAATKSDIGQASSTSLSQLVTLTTTRFFRSRSGAIGGFSEATSLPGFQGVNRSDSAGYTGRYNQTEYPVVSASVSPSSNNHFVFARNVDGTVDSRSDARLAFYSIGTSVSLSALDARVSTLVTAIGAAI